MNKTDIVREYRDRYGIEMPSKKLARIIYKDHNLLFKDAENIRVILRAIEGKRGGTNRTRATHIREESRPYNPYKLPSSEERQWIPYRIEGVNKLGIMSDIHLPYHSISAITCTIDYFLKSGIDGLLLNGDILDAFQLSRFVRDPKKRSFADELECYRDFIESLRATFGNIPIFYKIGNHEERYQDFIFMKAHELAGVPETNFNQLIENRSPGVKLIGEKRVIHANGLDIIHGHEFASGFFSPVNIARGLQLRAKTNAMQGHNHVTSEHTEPNLRGEIKTTWSIGCLCELHPEFMPINKWNHGAATVELSNNSEEFRVNNFRIYNGKKL